MIPTASIILRRTSGEVLMARRSKKLRSYPGAWVFPGGKIEHEVGSWKGDEKFVVETALRELFEETGVVLGHGVIPAGAREGSWVENLSRTSEELRSEIVFAGRRVTPPFGTRVFHASYLHLCDKWLDGVQPIGDGEEIVEVAWMEPAEMISRYERGDAFLPPPILRLLRLISEHGDGFVAVSRSDEAKPIGLQTPIEFAPGFEAVPLLSRTAPPFSATNLGIVRGDEITLLIDPGWDREQAPNGEAVVRHVEGDVLVFLTHHHRDHVAALDIVATHHPQAVVIAHQFTLDRVETSLQKQATGGLELDLGGRVVELIHAPGHTKGHMVLFDRASGVLYGGDHVVGKGSALLDPNSGSMVDYMNTLDMLDKLEARAVIPSHGMPSRAVKKILGFYRTHRMERERAILNAVDAGASSMEEILTDVYGDVGRELWPYARFNISLHLDKLVHDGELKESAVNRIKNKEGRR